MNRRILLTNDDGVDAPGLAVLQAIAAEISDDVWTVAPDSNQSGAGHRFSLRRELEIEQRSDRVFAIIGGSPADCVVAGMTHILGDKPADLVLSGVNAGQNLGDIIHASGTAAGAREGALQGAIAIAMSQSIDFKEGRGREISWANATRHGAATVRAILAAHAGEDIYYNVNFPDCAAEAVTGISVVQHQRFARSPFSYYPSDNAGKFFVSIPQTPTPLNSEHDFEVLRKGNAITVTPLLLQQTDLDALDRLRGKLVMG
jgi:5'-nucleotidase